MIKGIKLVTVPVSNQEEAVRFYSEKLGFKKTTDQPFGEGVRWIEMSPPQSHTRIVLYPPMPGQQLGSFQPIVFTTDDVEATYREMTERGVEFSQPPKTEDWGTSSVFKDQDGNMFALTSDVEAGIAE